MADADDDVVDQHSNGAALFKNKCASCHTGFLGSTAPSPHVLKAYSPEAILRALTTGVMRTQGFPLSGSERRAIAEHVTGNVVGSSLGEPNSGYCEEGRPMRDASSEPGWVGWGNGSRNHGFQSLAYARIPIERVPDLELSWAFGFPDSYSAWAQPVVAGGRIFVGSQAGTVYALDAKTGCTYWRFAAQAGVRSAISVARIANNGASLQAIFFGDMTGNAYAVDGESGKLIWMVELENHSKARVTGSPTLYGNRLYVPMSSWTAVDEAGNGGECCTFRGSLSSVDIASGEVVWKSYTIPAEPKPLGKVSFSGISLWGPSGSAIWSSPTIDEKRGLVYVGTGNSYTAPAVNSDAIIAFDLATGRIIWSQQVTPNDVWLDGCRTEEVSCNANSIGTVYHSFDFGTAPMLVDVSDDTDLIVIGQKTGVAYALDPENKGEIVWQYRAGIGGILGGIVWGGAVDSKNAYFPLSDILANEPGGLHAIDLRSGTRAWFAPPSEPLCGLPRFGCNPAQPAGLAVIPGVVFSGSVDGGFRAFSTDNGKLLWQYDTNREFATVNNVKANGGSLIGAGPTVVDGMVYVNSGYGTNGGRVGNVLLAFSVGDPESE